MRLFKTEAQIADTSNKNDSFTITPLFALYYYTAGRLGSLVKF